MWVIDYAHVNSNVDWTPCMVSEMKNINNKCDFWMYTMCADYVWNIIFVWLANLIIQIHTFLYYWTCFVQIPTRANTFGDCSMKPKFWSCSFGYCSCISRLIAHSTRRAVSISLQAFNTNRILSDETPNIIAKPTARKFVRGDRFCFYRTFFSALVYSCPNQFQPAFIEQRLRASIICFGPSNNQKNTFTVLHDADVDIIKHMFLSCYWQTHRYLHHHIDGQHHLWSYDVCCWNMHYHGWKSILKYYECTNKSIWSRRGLFEIVKIVKKQQHWHAHEHVECICMESIAIMFLLVVGKDYQTHVTTNAYKFMPLCASDYVVLVVYLVFVLCVCGGVIIPSRLFLFVCGTE